MKLTSFVLAAAFIAAAGPSFAQTGVGDNHAAPGAVAPNAARVLPNGDVAPPPSERSNGGVGATTVGVGSAQTRSGGPAGGYGSRN